MNGSEPNFSLSNYFSELTLKKVSIIIFSISLIVFGLSLFNGFVYDDDLQVVSNPLVHSLAYIPYFFQGGTFFDAGSGQITSIFYRPVLSIFFTLIYTFSGGYAFLFHLFQVILHGINALLLFILFRKFFREKLALFLSIIFLVHPINQEAVVYISNLQESLFFFFGLSAVLLSNAKLKKTRRILSVNVLLLLAFLSKETAILFVPIIILYTSYFNKKSFNKKLITSVLITTLVYLCLRFLIIHTSPLTSALMPIMHASLYERFLTMPSIIFYYIKTFFFPNQLALGHAWVITSPSMQQFFLPLLFDVIFFIGILFLGLRVKKRYNEEFLFYLFFCLWFILGLVMHMQLIPIDATVADRWFYFPIVGLLGLMGILLQEFEKHKNINYQVIVWTGIFLITILSIRTMVRNANWVDNLTLCQHDLPYLPESYNVQSACGSQFIRIGAFDEAKKHFAIAAQLEPDYSFNWYQYGISYESTNDIPKAREYYLKSIHLSNEVNAYVSLAATYLKYDNNPSKAKSIVEEGLSHYPNFQRLQLYLAVCEYKLHNKKKAVEIANRANQLSPTAESQYVLTQITNDQEVILH